MAAATAALLCAAGRAEAGCAPAPTAGIDIIVCDAATPPDPEGNIDFLGGIDDVTVNSGTYGDFTFGGGADLLEINSGNIGAVLQGAGIDIFIMHGGVINSLDQSGGFDIFTMTGGTILGLFDNGDIATVSGGTIGEVDLNVGNNIFDMSGGTVIGNVSAQQNNDTFTLSGGSIGGNVTTGLGTDMLTWSGTAIGGAIDLGGDNDTAVLQGLTQAIASGPPLIDGGLGTDELTFDNTAATGVGRFVNWETVDLTNGSQVTLDADFVLGDAGTGTGALSIDGTSTLFAGAGANASIMPSVAGQLVTVTNAGLIDLTNGPAAASDSVTVLGDYVGAGGRLALHTVLESDGSPSDKLVIDDGTATGATGIEIVNLGGGGAQTTGDGILVVEAVNGATTAAGSFSLAAPAGAGQYEYLLFQGGAGGANPENWYLRSTLVTASGQTIPLIRPEVAVQSTVPDVARRLGLVTLGTYHERVGGQNLWTGQGSPSGAWGRLFGQHTQQHFEGGTRSEFDGTFAGLQAGGDLWGSETPSGHRDRAGFYVARAQAHGDVRGFAIGVEDARAGEANLDASSLGLYWTHIGPSGWYVDAVLQGSLIDGTPHSNRGIGADVEGEGFAASIEGGYPIALGPRLFLEPQAQAIWQDVSLDNTRDALSTIRFDASDAFVGRLGARLVGTVLTAEKLWRPYAKVNVWWNSADADTITFADDLVPAQAEGTMLEAGGGLTAELTQRVSLYGDASYATSVEGEDSETIKGNIGLRVRW